MKKLILLFLFIVIFISQPACSMEHSLLEDLEQECLWYQRAPESYRATKHSVNAKIEMGGYACYACAMCCACCKVVAPHVVKAAVVIASKKME